MMERGMLSQRRIGVNFNDSGEAKILIWAPLAKSVALVFSNQTSLELKPADPGHWEISTALLKPGDRYQFKVDQKPALPDPATLSQPDGVQGASQAINLNSFSWGDQYWDNIPLSDYIIYELHTGTFSPSGDFEGISAKLDHLVELGVTAIEIMPVAQFPGSRNWGYDGVFPFAVQNSYGGPEKLQQLVNTCHEKGLAVILDVVYNHVGPEGNYFAEFGPFFTDKYHTPWGEAINFDDSWCDGVRNYFIENVLMWFRDFHIDALRMDAVHAIKDLSAKHILKEMKMQVEQLMDLTGKRHYLMVECDLNDPRYLDDTDKNGFGMDAQWIDEFHHALRVTAGEPQTGYYEDFNGIQHLGKAYNDAYVYDGQYSKHRKKIFGAEAADQAGSEFIVFSQNHDQVGNRMLGERSSTLYSFEMQKLLAAAVICSPFLPMLFMGEEWGESNPFLYFVSHNDQELNLAVRKGRKAEFAAFHNKGEAPDPDKEQTFLDSRLQWDLLNKESNQTMFSYYKNLTALRKKHPALCNCNRKNVETWVLEAQNCLILKRWEGAENLLCLMNFSKTEQIIPYEEALDELILDSSDAQWNGPGHKIQLSSNSKITLQSESIVIYTVKNA